MPDINLRHGSDKYTGVVRNVAPGVNYQVAKRCSECVGFKHGLYVTCKGWCELNGNIAVWHSQVCDNFTPAKDPHIESYIIV